MDSLGLQPTLAISGTSGEDISGNNSELGAVDTHTLGSSTASTPAASASTTPRRVATTTRAAQRSPDHTHLGIYTGSQSPGGHSLQQLERSSGGGSTQSGSGLFLNDSKQFSPSASGKANANPNALTRSRMGSSVSFAQFRGASSAALKPTMSSASFVPSSDPGDAAGSSDDEDNGSKSSSSTDSGGAAEREAAAAATGNSCPMCLRPHGKSTVSLNSTSFGCLTGDNSLRIFVFNLIHTKTFEGLVILVILMNCVLLALDDPTEDEKPQYQVTLDYFFIGAFSAEMLLKMFALGVFAHDGAYLRNSWNMLDFVIVVLSYLALVPGFGNYTALRTLRVLRPLRSMNAIPQLKTIVVGLLHSVRGLANVLLLSGFIFGIFGILAVQLWMGNYKYRCINSITGEVLEESFCSLSADDYGGLTGKGCDVAGGFICARYENPNNGYTSFDNVYWAFLVIIQCITLEGWALVMFNCMDHSGWPVALYFVLLILIGSYFVLNLALAVINFEFVDAKAAYIEKQKALQQEEELMRRQSVQGIKRMASEMRHSMIDRTLMTPPPSFTKEEIILRNKICDYRRTAAGRVILGVSDEEVRAMDHTMSLDERVAAGEILDDDALWILPQRHCIVEWWARFRYACFTITEGDPVKVHQVDLQERKLEEARAADDHQKPPPTANDEVESDTTVFVQVIVVCIFLNTALLAAESHDQSDTQTEIVEWFNLFFAIIFVIEMIMKLVSLGFRGYADDNFNLFDGFITIISVVELMFLDSGGIFAVFRALRLLRVFRLLKNFPSLRGIVEVLLIAVKETGYLNVIILLYLFIAALVGMQLFGGNFPHEVDGDPVRSTFDNFYWSFYTVFQILTRDSWPDIMWLAMKETHETASIYFLLCVVFGDFIILNLFLAILISSFDIIANGDEEEEEDPEVSLRHRSSEVVLSSGSSAGNMLVLQNTHGVKESGTFLVNTNVNEFLKDTSNVIVPVGSKAVGPFFTDQQDADDALHGQSSASPHHQSLGDIPSRQVSQQFLDEEEERVCARPIGVCTICGDPIYKPFPTATIHIKSLTPQQLHSRMCDRIQFRKLKEKAISDILRAIGDDPDVLAAAEEASRRRAEEEGIPFPTTGGGRPWTASDGDDSHDNSKEFLPQPSISKPQPSHGTFRSTGAFSSEEAIKKTTRANENNPLLPEHKSSTTASSSASQQHPQKDESKGNITAEVSSVIRKLNSQVLNRKTFETFSPMPDKEHPTPEDVEEMFGRAWEVGLFLGERLEDYLYMQNWSPLRTLLYREREVLSLRVGEEQVGRALVAYTRANIPREFHTNGGDSLWVFTPHNSFRIFLTQIVTHPYFDRGILVCILCSSILMALDNPRNAGTTMAFNIELAGYIFTGIFILEAVMKIISFGFALHPTAYIRDSWNILDFFIVVVSVISLILSAFDTVDLGFLKVLRTFRTLRPLRVINRNRGIKMVVSTLLQSIKGIANVALISLIVYLVFAILGVQLFAGKMYHCTDESIHERVACFGDYNVTESDHVMREVNVTTVNSNGTEIVNLVNASVLVLVEAVKEREWVTEDFNFDNTYESFLSLFHAATLDNWGETMFAAIDVTDIHHGPIRNNHPENGLFFIVFIVVGSFFLLNMFVGVIIFNFNMVKMQMDGSSWLTQEQKLWVETQRMMLNFRPQKKQIAGSHWIQQACFYIALSPKFELGTGFAILLNIIFIGMESHEQSDDFTLAMYIANVIFVFIFVVEAGIKIVAFGRNYFLDNWSRFDFFIVVVSIVDLAVDGAIQVNVGLLRVLRIFRLMRILALVKKAKDVQILLETLWYSLPSLANIGAFLILIFFVYAVLGVQIFALVKRNDGLTDHKNFEDFGTSFLFLIQVATLDDWGETMIALMNTDDCGPHTNERGWDNCGTPAAPIFFVTFILMAGFVMVNLFVAIILDNFNTTMQLNKSTLKVADLKRFADAWANFDPHATYLVETKRFPRLLHALKPPLGIARTTDRLALLQATRKYAIPEHGGVIHFVETLIPLARQVLGVEFTDEEIRDHEDNWKTQFPDIMDLRILRYRQKRVTVDQYFAATFMASAYRRRIAAKFLEEKRDEKRKKLTAWYDEHGVEEVDRIALHEMDKGKDTRDARRLENEKLMEEYAAAGAQEDDIVDGHENEAEDDEVPNQEQQQPRHSTSHGTESMFDVVTPSTESLQDSVPSSLHHPGGTPEATSMSQSMSHSMSERNQKRARKRSSLTGVTDLVGR